MIVVRRNGGTEEDTNGGMEEDMPVEPSRGAPSEASSTGLMIWPQRFTKVSRFTRDKDKVPSLVWCLIPKTTIDLVASGDCIPDYPFNHVHVLFSGYAGELGELAP